MLDLQGFQLYLMRMERSENTITSYLRDVASYIKWYDASFCLLGEASSTFWYDASFASINEMTLIHYKRYLNQKERSIITANRKLASVNAFCHYLYEEGILSEIYAVKLTKNRDKPEYKGLPVPELHALRKSILASANTLHICIIELLLATGIRVSELTGLTMTDITLSGQNCIRVYGKGSVHRTLPLNDAATAALVEYLIVRGTADTDRLLVGQRGALGRGAVEIILGNYGKALCIKVTPHMLRHSLAYQLIKSGVAMTTIQQILGHESILTTNLYTQTTAQDKADALMALAW